MFRAVGDKLGTTWSLHSLGEAALAHGDFQEADAFFRDGLGLHRQTGNKHGAAECLDGVARVAMITGELGRAAHLFAASAALREATGAPADASHRSEAGRALSTVRAGLGDEMFASEWNEGKRMGLEQAIAYALEEPS